MPQNSLKPAWPQSAMVGYIDMTATGSMDAITQDQIQAYNVVIFGFAAGDGTVNPDQMQAAQTLIKQETPGTLNLISFGGAFETVTLTENTIQNLISVVETYDLDGIDLDIEDPGITEADFNSFASNLSAQIKDKYLLTTAPILAGTSTTPTLNIPSGVSLEQSFSNDYFDAILVQAYNSGTSFAYPLPSDPSQLVNETTANIISAAYNALQQKGGINEASKIVIGIPANAGGAPSESNLWNVTPFSDATPLIKTNFLDIMSGNYGINPSQFGGMMTWSLNTDAMPDAYPPFPGFENGPAGYFAENVAPLVTARDSAQAAE